MENAREELDWRAFGVASRDLAREIADSGFRPDIILAIARGGLFVAGALGYALAVKNLHVMNVEFYNGVGTTLDMPVMLPPVPSAVDFSAKKVLIADDVADTGKTLELVRNFVSGHVAEVRAAVIYEKTQSLIKCDYVWRRTDSWINFPWSSQPPVIDGLGVLDA
ncbi:MAG: phosphoribosyltransferase [Trebonia sp.]|jgi:hypoxanthine phosphoribosyltransferase